MKVEWRHLGREFGEIGIFNLAIEQFIGWIKIMLHHFHTATTLSQMITASIEALQLEVGCGGNLMNENYAEGGLLATDYWVKAVWECAHHHNFCIHLNYQTQHLPRQQHQELVDIFLEHNIKGKDLMSLNQCCIAHGAMYLSCIATVDGTHIERAFVSPPMKLEVQSIWKFCHETPTAQEWMLWEAFWQQLQPVHDSTLRIRDLDNGKLQVLALVP